MIFIACLSTPVSVVRAGNTVLTVNEAGVIAYYFIPPTSTFSVTNTDLNTLTIVAHVPPNENGVNLDSTLTFRAAGDARLVPGAYYTLGCDDDGSPRPYILAAVPNPYPTPTHFLVKEITYSADNQVTALDIVFGDFDTDEPAILVGEIMFNSSLPLVSRNHITSSLREFGTQGQPFVYQIRASGPQTHYSATNLPPGVTVDPSTGRLSGIPATAGTFNIGLSSTDSDGTAVATLVVTVEPPAVSIGTHRAFLFMSDPGDVVTQGITQLFNREDYVWSWFTYGDYGFRIDVLSPVDSKFRFLRFTMPGNQTLAPGHYNLSSVPSSTNGSMGLGVGAYSFDSASGSIDVREVCLDPVKGSLLHLRASFSIEDSFSPGSFVTGEIWLDSEVAITSPVFVTGIGGDPFQYQIVTNVTGPFSYATDNLPPGLTLDNATGLISGIPSGTGVYKIPITVTAASTTISDTLTLKLLPSEYLVNLSTRGRVDAGDSALIGGFIIDGPDLMRVALRSLGGSLLRYKLPVLIEPQTTFHTFWTNLPVIITNWTLGDQVDEINELGLETDYSTDDIYLTDGYPGPSTSVLEPFHYSDYGIALMEIYDVDPSSNSRLVNLSTRGFVGSGDYVMIGGFILGGKAGTGGKVGIFAKGPSLSAAGVSGVLGDPTLDLYDSNGTLLRSDDNWQDSQEEEIAATGIAPSDPRESGVVAQLPLGAYTAIVRGKDNTTGIGLVEIYDLSSGGL